MTIEKPYRAFIESRQKAHQWRNLDNTQILPNGRARRNGQELINFSSNDYLGLSQHPNLITRAQDYTKRYGAGSTASRLVTGNHGAYAMLEDRLARGKGCQAALIMNSGYQANLTALAALADSDVLGKQAIILADRLCHNSILQGAMLSGARLIRYHHNDHQHLESLLQQYSSKDAQIIIVTETVFGMDGDRADLPTLITLKQKYNGLLYVDEAHATGLFGMDGFGLASEHKGRIDVVMGTFGKALGSFGAYIACTYVLHNYLIQRCGGLIYSTGLPPSVLGSIEAAIELMPTMNAKRNYVLEQAIRVRLALQRQGWNCGNSTTQIIPIILGNEQAATALAEILLQNGILVPAIRPPTVPKGTSRLRLSLSAAHSKQDIDQLISVLADRVQAAA